MSLRGRLTLLNTSLVGGILLLFSVAVYIGVNFTLTNQIDQTLRQTAEDIRRQSGLEAINDPLSNLPIDVFIQVWKSDGHLDTNVPQLAIPLDKIGYKSGVPVFRNVHITGVHLRVLTVPMETAEERPAGTIQVAMKLSAVDATQQTLPVILGIGTLLALAIAGLLVWLSNDQTLRPLLGATQAAMHITKTDDLSRRIPYQGPAEDELGQLIHSFNQTLGRLESQLHMQRRFMADVGHELRTPLTVVKGNVDLLRHMGCTDEESLSSIESEVDRLTRLVGDLLLLAQAESGKITLDRRTLELDTLVLEALSQMHVLVRDKQQLRLGDIDQVLVCGDRDRLKQVLVNLIGNSIKYTPSGGEVVVGLGKVGNQARLTVSDNGPGIPVEDLPHIFERFYRGEKSRTRTQDGKGFGLGLSIAYWIVRNHGGRIEVDSAEGRGTTFCVWLPLAEEECQEEAPVSDKL
jgi:two-component system OmpR family sensor kinase